MKLLRELQDDLTTQHRIAADLLNEVCKRFRFPYQRQCVLDTVSVVAATISNLQKLAAVMAQRDEISQKELGNLHKAVEDHVQRLLRELRPWLSYVLPITISGAGLTEDTELEVSICSIFITPQNTTLYVNLVVCNQYSVFHYKMVSALKNSMLSIPVFTTLEVCR